MNLLVAGNPDQSDCLSISRLKANRRPGCNVQAIAMRSNAVELELRIRFREVVMRSDL